MASFRDYLSGKIAITKANLSKAVSTLSSVANKRLKRMESKGWRYTKSNPDDEGDGYVAGYKKFGAKGKDSVELQNELKRLTNFLHDDASTITGYRKEAAEARVAVEEYYQYSQRREQAKIGHTRAEIESLERDMKRENVRAKNAGRVASYENYASPWDWQETLVKGLELYNYLVSHKMYIPTKNDSNQARDVCDSIVNRAEREGWSFREMVEFAAEQLTSDYKHSIRNEQDGDDYGTSALIFGSN